MYRLYENTDIVIFRNDSKCNRSCNCVTGCPMAFDFAYRPWTDLSRADNTKVWRTVETWPSGG